MNPIESISEELVSQEQFSSAKLANFFMLSHVEDDGPVRIDGAKLGVLEALGLELDEAKLGAFAGALNANGLPGSSSSSVNTRPN